MLLQKPYNYLKERDLMGGEVNVMVGVLFTLLIGSLIIDTMGKLK